MTNRVPREQYPWWVRLTSFMAPGATTRRGQWTYFGLSLVAAAVCVAAFFVLNLRQSTAIILGTGAVAFVGSAIWYVVTIRWIDRNGTWQ